MSNPRETPFRAGVAKGMPRMWQTSRRPLRLTGILPSYMTTSLAYGGAGWGTVWGEQMALDELRKAGFAEVSVEKVEGDILNNYYISRK